MECLISRTLLNQQRFVDKDKIFLKELRTAVGIRRLRRVKDVIFDSKEFESLEKLIENKISFRNSELLKKILKNHPTFKSLLFRYQEETNHG